MGEHQGEEEQEVARLSDLQIESVGLVRKGANRKPFFFIKSIDGGNEDMSEKEKEDFAATLAELAEVKEVNQEAWAKLLEIAQGQAAQLATRPEPEPEPGTEPEPEPASEPEPDLYAEALAEAEERFAEELKTEREAREEIAEKFAESERLRRLAEFTDNVTTDFASLPVGEAETFAADLMAIHDADAERHGRLVGVLKAAQEAVKQGALFEQFSSAQPASGADPFLAKVEAIQRERFADLGADEGFREAMIVAEREHKDLARVYANTH